MELSFGSRLKHAWNAFLNRDPPRNLYGGGFSYRPDRLRLTRGNERTIITAIYNRIALDAAAITINHVKLDESGRFDEVVDSGLNRCLTLEANIDQTGRSLVQDIVMSMLDEGVAAVVPVDFDKAAGGGYEVGTLRVGKVMEWYPDYVRVQLYNDRTGQKEEVTLPKKMVALIENPFYAVMNEPNSTMQRLMGKLRIMDAVDEQAGSGKLDLIIQLPYAVKSEMRKKQANDRRKDLEEQLAGSRYGIGYVDATEHITQLNRSLENNILKSVEYLTTMLYSQLGITQEIMNGTADDAAMTNYENRTIEPILSAIVDELKRKFLTDEDRKDRQSILFFRDPFKLAPIGTVAEMADKFTRNEIMSSNEFRQVIGLKPSKDPKADQLLNKNLSPSEKTLSGTSGASSPSGRAISIPGKSEPDE